MAPSVRALGFSAPGTRVASIAYPRVEQLARGGGPAVGLLLGHVVAHELGHLLLRQATHSPTGLMRATLDIALAQQGRLLLTSDESEAIRTPDHAGHAND